ncbi:hypothetical protein [Companilactobacillus sp.]|uniref:hypothetical protein n=1 Tax=Companilactobacillus sp. TaxID=2767905 RepID=UPI00261EA0D3|nr:hypothetical protein [Companilactobacillus sp.]
MTDNERHIIEAFKRYYKKSPRHSYSLLVVKDRFNDTYNFYLEEVDGATYSHGLGSIDFDQLDEYKNTLRRLMGSKLKVEYRGF